MHTSICKYALFAVSAIACLYAGHSVGAEPHSIAEQKPSVEILDGLAEASPTECEQWPGCICVEINVVVGLPQRFSLTRSCPHPMHENIRLISNFDANGQEIDRGQMKDGKAHGIWISWYPSGELNAMGSFENGKPQGDYTVWYPSGLLMAEGHNFDFGENGDHFRYSESGNVEHHSVWLEGKLINNLSASFRPLEPVD